MGRDAHATNTGWKAVPRNMSPPAGGGTNHASACRRRLNGERERGAGRHQVISISGNEYQEIRVSGDGYQEIGASGDDMGLGDSGCVNCLWGVGYGGFGGDWACLGGSGALERVGLYGLEDDLGGVFCYHIVVEGRN